MRAFVLTRYGGPEATELRDMPKPAARDGEILVRVHAAGLNPVDFKLRKGKLRIIRRYALPVVVGNELSGVVESVGGGVTRFAIGDRVFARVAKESLGAFAEWACVREEHAAKLPASLDFDAAAAVPLAALTALQALRDELHVAPKERIFVPGGAGGVGTFALQLAKQMGAEVATTASLRGDALVRRLGADVVVDYTKARFEDSLRDYDGVFDLVGGDDLARVFAVVRRGARVVSIAGPPEPETARKDLARGAGLAALFWITSFAIRGRARRSGASYRYLFMHPSGADLEHLAALIARGSLEVVLDRVFDFDRIAGAMAYLESGRAKGKVVVRFAV
ncbi:MAG TPA: NADP-dependent oxidoreductase [Polyangiaceae bacterium]|jgi:alcohol dehydrogenase|nr:NADP-dependent oxidoreductase [Polyangiaceae bacterium]